MFPGCDTRHLQSVMNKNMRFVTTIITSRFDDPSSLDLNVFWCHQRIGFQMRLQRLHQNTCNAKPVTHKTATPVQMPFTGWVFRYIEELAKA